MTKAELIDQVVGKTGLARTHAYFSVESFIDAVKSSLEDGHNIEIRGFGTFKVKPRKARKARNPRTGEAVPVPERKVPVFKPSIEFKKLVMESEKNQVD